MSVIPLNVDGDQPTVVQAQADFSLKGSAILVRGLEGQQLEAGQASNVSYDLRIGEQFRDHRSSAVKNIPEGGVIELRPGSAFVIQTEESIHLPIKMFGIIAPKVTLLERGLSSTFSKVDPGYDGHLLVTLFNLGKTTVFLNRGDRFCALTLFDVGPGARAYEKGPKQITAERAKQPRQKFLDWVETHKTAISLLVLAGNFILFFLTIEFSRSGK